jgi:glutamate racemase
MKIGVFDSGLGGLFILKSLKQQLPQYDYLYLGDTKNLPYGNKNQAQIYTLTRRAVDYLFKNNCQLVILACNTASAQALRRIQQEYLPKKYPNRRVLGVIIPTAEEVKKYSQVGVIATTATVKSQTFVRELKKVSPKIQVIQSAAPELVPLIESKNIAQIKKLLPKYLKPLKNCQAIILGCTHYPIIARLIHKEAGKHIKIISQTDIIPLKLKNYLVRHPEIEKTLSQKGQTEFWVTKLSPLFKKQAEDWFGHNIRLKLDK